MLCFWCRSGLHKAGFYHSSRLTLGRAWASQAIDPCKHINQNTLNHAYPVIFVDAVQAARVSAKCAGRSERACVGLVSGARLALHIVGLKLYVCAESVFSMQLLWFLPFYIISLVLTTVWFNDIATAAFTAHFHRKPVAIGSITAMIRYACCCNVH